MHIGIRSCEHSRQVFFGHFRPKLSLAPAGTTQMYQQMFAILLRLDVVEVWLGLAVIKNLFDFYFKNFEDSNLSFFFLYESM